MKRLLICGCLFLAILVVGLRVCAAQVSEYDRARLIRDHLLDQLPIDIASLKGPHFARVVLKFYNPDAEMVLVIYAGWKCELVSYTLTGEGGQPLSKYIAEMVRTHPQLRDDEIERTVHVATRRSFVDSQRVKQDFQDLQTINISPFFQTVVAVDEYSDYEYRFEPSSGESVRYRLHAVPRQGETGELIRWMTKFREDFK